MRISVKVILILAFNVAIGLHGEEMDSIKTKFEKAKATYERELEKARTAVLEGFTEREDGARKKGDLKAVNEIKYQRVAFEISDDIQKYFTPQIRATLVEANKAFDSVYKEAIKDYLRAKKDDEANKLQAEYDVVKIDFAPVEAAPIANKVNPLISPGMVFEGNGESREPKKVHKLFQVLTIESVDGNKVTGHIVGKPDGQNFKFIGVKNATGDTLEWTSDKENICHFAADGSVIYTWTNAKNWSGNYNLHRTSSNVDNGAAAVITPQKDPAYTMLPEAKKPPETVVTKTLTGQLYSSKGGTFLDNNLILLYVDGTEGQNKRRLFDASKGRQIIQLIASEPRFAFPLRDGADKHVRASVTGRFDGPNRLWLTADPREIDRKPEIGLGRP